MSEGFNAVPFADYDGQKSFFLKRGDGSLANPYDSPNHFFKNQQVIGPFGEALTADRFDHVSVNFANNQLNTKFDVKPSVLTGDGSTGVANSSAYVDGGTTGSALVESLDVVRYINGHSMQIQFTASFTGNGIGYAGGFGSDNGFPLKYDNGVLSFGYLDEGVETGFTQLDTSFITGFDASKLNVYMVLAGYLGVANPVLFCRKGGEWYKVAEIQTEGLLDNPHVKYPAFPIAIKASSNCIVKSGSWNGSTFGSSAKNNQDRYIIFPNIPLNDANTTNYGEHVLAANTNVQTIAVFHAKNTFNGKPNLTRAKLISVTITADPPSTGEGTVTVQIVKNPQFTTPPVYTSVSVDDSVVEYDVKSPATETGPSAVYDQNGTYDTVFTAAFLHYSATNKSGTTESSSTDPERLGAFLRPDETMAIIARNTSATAVTLRYSLSWVEESS